MNTVSEIHIYIHSIFAHSILAPLVLQRANIKGGWIFFIVGWLCSYTVNTHLCLNNFSGFDIIWVLYYATDVHMFIVICYVLVLLLCWWWNQKLLQETCIALFLTLQKSVPPHENQSELLSKNITINKWPESQVGL